MAILTAPPSLSDPQFRRYSLGTVLALVGMWAQRTVLAWLAWDLTGAASWVGVIAFCAFAPTILFSPIFGVFADRANLKHAALGIQIAQVAITLSALALLFLGWLDIWVLALVTLVYGVVISAHHPVRMALTPLLVQRGDLPNAIAVTSMSFNLARLLGPAIAGAVIASYGVGSALILAVATMAPLIVVLAYIEPHAPDGQARAPAGVFAAITEGVGIAYGRRIIRLSMALTTLLALIVRGMLELLPTIADGMFARGADGFGQLMAAAGAGALVAAIWMAGNASPSADRLPRRALVAIVVGFVVTSVIGFSGSWLLTVCAVAVAGFCGTSVGVTLQSTVQMNIRDGERGRVMSLWSIVAIGAAAVGALILGAAADLVGIGGALVGGAAFGGIGVAMIALTSR